MTRLMIFIVLQLTLAGANTMAQHFVGEIKDQKTKEPVPYATIYFIELETGTTSDGEGTFHIEHSPSMKVQIQISAVGYKTLGEVLDLSSQTEKEFLLAESHVDLEEVVISTPAGKLESENVVSIERRSLTELEEGSPASLAEALSAIPGVSQNSTGTGIGKPVIRGLSGSRIVTFAQGIRIENQQWGAEHGLGVGAVGIGSVEVIKGPASLLYGSDALGGVLYFVNERYAEHNTIQGYVKSRFMSNSLGSANNMAVKLHKGRVKLNLFGSYTSNADYLQPNNERVFNTRFDEKNLKASLGYDLRNWISNIRYSYLQNNFGIPEDSIFTTTDREMVMPYQLIDNHALSWENTIFLKNTKLNVIGGYTGNRRKEFEDHGEDSGHGHSHGHGNETDEPGLDMNLKTFSYNAKWYAPEIKGAYNFIFGIQGMSQTNLNRGEEALVPDGVTNDFGAMSIFNYVREKLSMQVGLRMDERAISTEMMAHEDGDSIDAFAGTFQSVNFAVGSVYREGNSSFRANISSGFRAPTTSELLSFGTHEGTNRFEIGNSSLRSEMAKQVDLSYSYRSEHLSFEVNTFYNSIDNYIYLEPWDSVMDDVPVYAYTQSAASLYGGEAGVHFHPHSVHWLHLESNFSTVIAEDKYGNALPLIPANTLATKARVELEKKGKWGFTEIYMQHIYTFRQDRPALFETATADYTLINTGFAMEFGEGENPIQFSAGVRNLLNQRYIDHLSRLKPMGFANPGMNVYVTLKIPFEKVLPEDEH